MEGAEFDCRYVRQMVQDHQDVMKLAQKTAKDAER
jgi:predicted outer membrane protein